MSIRRGDIVIVELDPTGGSEQRGSRPYLVVQNDVGNKNAPTTIVVPLTTSFGDELYPFEVLLPEAEANSEKIRSRSVVRFERCRSSIESLTGSARSRATGFRK